MLRGVLTGLRTEQRSVALEFVRLLQVKHGFVLLPRRWLVERTSGWFAHFHRLTRDYERLLEALTSLHLVALTVLLLNRAAELAASA
ncbi:hypothetical protein D9599_22795 [Roseomonas sp. KE2513]|nr:hypothetical protein [Roseomonas sp. KE2513]